MNNNPFATRGFWLTAAITAIWVNVSEVARYFLFIMPMMREAMPMLPEVAPMNAVVFAIWGVWDTIWLLTLCGSVWLWLERFGPSTKQTYLAATLVWAAVFVIVWLGIFNMNLTGINVVAVALPLAWLEAVVGAFIVRWGMLRYAAVDLSSPQATTSSI